MSRRLGSLFGLSRGSLRLRCGFEGSDGFLLSFDELSLFPLCGFFSSLSLLSDFDRFKIGPSVIDISTQSKVRLLGFVPDFLQLFDVSNCCTVALHTGQLIDV